MANNEITYDQFMEMKRRMDEAENDTTPYAVVDDENVHVIGDPNKTGKKTHDYKMQFAFPNTDEWKSQFTKDEIFNETMNYIGVEKTYANVWVPPVVATAVQTAFTEFYAFFNIVMDNGDIRDLTVEEVKLALRELNQEMVESMNHAVGTVLRIDPRLEPWMLITQTANTMFELINDFPEVINGMDFFSDKSQENG